MTNYKAARILDSLARGEDPDNHQAIPAHDVLSRPDIIRALFLGAHALERLTAEPYENKREKRKDLPAGAGRPWDKSEEDLLIEEFNSCKSITDIASNHSRTKGAIRARLIRLGLLDDRNDDPRRNDEEAPQNNRADA